MGGWAGAGIPARRDGVVVRARVCAMHTAASRAAASSYLDASSAAAAGGMAGDAEEGSTTYGYVYRRLYFKRVANGVPADRQPRRNDRERRATAPPRAAPRRVCLPPRARALV